MDGCSSHSGHRTFVTKAARKIVEAGGSLRDVQQLAGHRSLQTTHGYIDENAQAKRSKELAALRTEVSQLRNDLRNLTSKY